MQQLSFALMASYSLYFITLENQIQDTRAWHSHMPCSYSDLYCINLSDDCRSVEYCRTYRTTRIEGVHDETTTRVDLYYKHVTNIRETQNLQTHGLTI